MVLVAGGEVSLQPHLREGCEACEYTPRAVSAGACRGGIKSTPAPLLCFVGLGEMLGFHRITEWLGLEGTFGGHLVQPAPAQAGLTQSWLPGTMSRQGF